MVAHAEARDHVVGWLHVPRHATLWFAGDEAGAVSHRVVMFWRSDVLGHSIAGGVLGQCGLWPTAAGWWGAVGSIRGCMQLSGEGLVWVFGHMRRAYDRRAAWWMREPKPTTTGYRGGGLRKPKLAAAR